MSAGTERCVAFTERERAEQVAVEPDSTPLAPCEVAGRTLATLISAGTELAAYQGNDFPARPGYAAAFQVDAVGSEVSDIRPGEVAFCMGPHRSFQRAQRDQVLPLPDGLAPEQAIFARIMSVGMSTLATTAARPPAQVLVTGLGLVGHCAARTFGLCGYRVIACDPAEVRREIAQKAGVKRVLPAVPLDDPAIAGQVDLVLECSGHERAALDGCRIVRKRGEVVLVGTPWKRRSDLFAHELLHEIFHGYIVLRSGWEWELPVHPAEFRHNSIYGNLAAALGWLAEGRMQVDGLYTTASPREAQQAYQNLLHGRNEKLATVFDWTAG